MKQGLATRTKNLIVTLVVLSIAFTVSRFWAKPTDDNSFSIPSPTNGQVAALQETEVPPPSSEPFVPTQAAIDSQWKLKSARVSGSSLPASLVNTGVMKLDGAGYESTFGSNVDRGTCSVDLLASPPRMTITISEGENAGKSWLAIFDMPNESTLRICYDPAAAKFPDSFDSTADNNYFSATYIRQP